MKIENFIQQVLEQITTACHKTGVFNAKDIEMTIQINDNGDVCREHEVAIASVRINL